MPRKISFPLVFAVMCCIAFCAISIIQLIGHKPGYIEAGLKVTEAIPHPESSYTYTIECTGYGRTEFKIRTGKATYQIGEYLTLCPF